jgi:hypothetical protein
LYFFILIKGRKHVEARNSGLWETMNPGTRKAHEQALLTLEKKIDAMIGMKLAMETALFDDTMIEQSVSFYGLVMMWIIKCATGSTEKIQWQRVSQGESFKFFLDLIIVCPYFHYRPNFLQNISLYLNGSLMIFVNFIVL